jgi:uncharacterized protein (TIGR02300 family)
LAAILANPLIKGYSMPKEEWGVKRVCPETGKRFYDLNNNPIVSPYTGKEYPLSQFVAEKGRATMADKADKSAIKKATESDDDDEVDVVDEADDVDVDIDVDVDLGDDVLEDDDDDEDTVSFETIGDVSAPDDDL